MNYRRILSHHNLGDQSLLNANDSSLANQTSRSISSSSSMLSTPSNNIRKLQQGQTQIGQGQVGQTSQIDQDDYSQDNLNGSSFAQGHSSTLDSSNDTFNRKSNRTRANFSKPRIHNSQARNHIHSYNHNNNNPTTHLKPKKSTNVNLVKNKLLNLQKSLKIYAKSRDDDKESNPKSPTLNNKNFILRKPINMNSYDYSVFTNYSNDGSKGSDSSLPPNIKESQIKAWESAEKVTNNLIFENDSDLSDDDEMIEGETKEDINYKGGDIAAATGINTGGATDTGGESDGPLFRQDPVFDIIKAIPGIIPSQSHIIFNGFKLLQQRSLLDKHNDLNALIEKEEDLLWKENRQQQLKRERLFKQYQSLTSKRKLQIIQKKEVFFKMFGANNTLNQDYITNNTSYSSLENVMNTSKSFHEDNDEIKQMLQEDKEFEISMNETQNLLNHQKSNILQEVKGHFNINLNDSVSNSPRHLSVPSSQNHGGDFDYGKFQKLITTEITKLYEEFVIDGNDPGIDVGVDHHQNTKESNEFNSRASKIVNDEFNNFALSYLRRCIKLEEDNGSDDLLGNGLRS